MLQKFRGELVLLDARGEGGGGGSGGNYDEGASPGGGFGGSAYGGGSAAKTQSRPQPAAFDSDLDDDVPF